jgi:hypothetical protein
MIFALILSALQSACVAPQPYDDVSAHLEALREADQADRREGFGAHVVARDAERLAAVKAYVEGECLETGRDHHNAALIHQHGDEPADYQTAWRHAVTAVDLGDSEAAWLIPRAIDRYFMNLGYKQLYATNSRGELLDPEAGPDAGYRMCLWPVVNAVTEAQREALGVRTVAQQLDRVAQSNGEPEGRFCDGETPDPPRGVFPGYW